MKKVMKKRQDLEKPKKVTIKFFLNKALQPMVEGREKRYPLYMLITYKRRNTTLRSQYGGYYKDLKEVDKLHYPGLLAFEEKVIRKTISYEQSIQADAFDMKGIYKKYEFYCVGIHVTLTNFLKNALRNVLLRLEPYEYARALNFSDPEVEFETLLTITKKVYKNLSDLLPKDFGEQLEIYQVFNKLYRGSFYQYAFPAVIEWLDKSTVEDYSQKLAVTYKNNPRMIEKSLAFIDQVVKSSITGLNYEEE